MNARKLNSALVALKGILGALDQPVTRRLRKENSIFNGDMCVIEHFAREAITDTQNVEITDADVTDAYSILIRTDSGYDFDKWRALIGPIELRLGIRDVLESAASPAKDGGEQAKPFTYMRFKNGKPDWAEDCIGEDVLAYVEDEDGDTYTAEPLYLHAQPLASQMPQQTELQKVMRTNDLNRRAEVETILLDISIGKRDLPTREECKKLALRLGVPEVWNESHVRPQEARHV